MITENIEISELHGFSGIKLKNDQPLILKPGINLMVGRNGSGKSNLLYLIEYVMAGKGNIDRFIESSFFQSKGTRFKRSQEISIDNFGEHLITRFKYSNFDQRINLKLKKELPYHVFKNALKDGVASHIEITRSEGSFSSKYVNNDSNLDNLDIRAHLQTRLFGRQDDNKPESVLNGPIEIINDYYRKKILQIANSEEFKNYVHSLQDDINSTLQKFLDNANKVIKLEFDEERDQINLRVFDNGNIIELKSLSHGEQVLYNFVFNLKSLKESNIDLIIFDEPEKHMHDDMIHEFLNELAILSLSKPEYFIILASHSTPLIEYIASYDSIKKNFILFDQDRNVFNSDKIFELINTIKLNGIPFSILMLTKQPNIFIENLKKGGETHKKFYLKFFPTNEKPNVFPIGFSGNVAQSKEIVSPIFDILNTPGIKSIGIQDGDVWFKRKLKSYIDGKLTLADFIQELKSHEEIYLQEKLQNEKHFYFGFWEIENLYLMDEVLECWTEKKSEKKLTKKQYKSIARGAIEIIHKEYKKTYLKAINKDLTDLTDNNIEFEKYLDESLIQLIDSIIEESLIQWLPGKELWKYLKNEFDFDDSNFDFTQTKLSKKIQRVYSYFD